MITVSNSVIILVNTNITQAILHGQERLLGYVPSFIVPTKFAATMNSQKLTRKLLTLFKPSTHNPCSTVTDNNSIIEQSTIKIWIHLPFLGKYGTKLTNSFIWKISPLLISPCKFIVNWKTTDANCFISLKDHTHQKCIKALLHMPWM